MVGSHVPLRWAATSHNFCRPPILTEWADMTFARSVVPILVLVLVSTARAIGAQGPTRDSTAVAFSIQRLPVLDLDGNVIPEDSITAVMQPGHTPFWRPALGVFGGLLMFTVMNLAGHDCDIYDPCTPREEWRQNAAPLTGMLIGLLVSLAYPDGSINRQQAVQLIRGRRQADKAAPK
jgi:hypothetical protein